jgi:hypothetical protein
LKLPHTNDILFFFLPFKYEEREEGRAREDQGGVGMVRVDLTEERPAILYSTGKDH